MENELSTQKNMVVSIILSESTASMLKATVPRLENNLEGSESMVCIIKSLRQSSIKFSSQEICRTFRNYFISERNKSIPHDMDRVTSDVAYLSTDMNKSTSSVGVLDDLSNLTINDLNNKSDIMDSVIKRDDKYVLNKDDDKYVLNKVKIYMRPLVSMKTEAHKDKLSAKDNNLFLTIVDSELSITQSGWINVCRICHGGESYGNLLSPCRCRGSIALTHLTCLERWLKESSNSRCELCQYHFEIVREPKYSVPWSILVFFRHPGDHYKELLLDLLAFVIYTPSAFASTYMLMLICEAIAKSNLQYNRNFSAHVMAFSAIFGIAAIDFTYSSWLIVAVEKHMEAWKNWYKNNCRLKLILPPWKQQRHRRRLKKLTERS